MVEEMALVRGFLRVLRFYRDYYKATCFDYRLVILRPILSIVSQDAIHTLGSHRVYIHEIHQIKSFVSKGVTCKLCLQEWDR